ncbi:RHS repeat-associated core domain-containing protein, partial [Cellulophaga sp. BC115SP]|uniref:RHS repeat-associated core domain-containing protein n=1 Tax=Cellulophaga sp. BC115SP TaxID=2683263 RepID=UPI001412DEB4
YQGNYYSAFGVSILSLGDNMTPTQTVLSNDRLYNGKELQDGTNWLDYGARMYYPELGRWMAVDPSHEDGGQESSTPYGYVFNNPAGHTDPDGRIPHVVAGAIAGGLIGGAIEAGRQVWNEGKVSNWRAVGGAALQGAITGGAAAATGGISYLATAGAAAGANVVGGAASRSLQGKETTTADVVVDAAVGGVVGAGGKFVGNVVKKALDNATTATKGRLGEIATEIKYATKGYVSEGKAVVPTGRATPTGRVQVAKYDHNFKNIFTGNRITVESKFNTAGLTSNQVAARPSVTTGGLIIDRTTSQQVGNVARTSSVSTGAGVGTQTNQNH